MSVDKKNTDVSNYPDTNNFKHYQREFSQGSICQEIYNIQTLFTIQNSVTIVHGPPGCISAAFGLNAMNRSGKFMRTGSKDLNIRWLSSNLTEIEIIKGGEGKLTETIRKAYQAYKPEVIFVFTTCAAGIIGDDIKSVLQNLRSEMDTILVPVLCEGFRRPKWGSTCNVAYEGIMNYLLEDRPKEKNFVNIITSMTVSSSDESEFSGLLNALGLKPNFIPCFSSLEQIRRSVSAEAVTSLCHSFGENYMSFLNEKYGTKMTEKHIPQSIASTDSWLKQLASVFNREKECDIVIENEHKKIHDKLKELRETIKGKRVFAGASLSRAITILELSEELGFELVGLSSYMNKDKNEDESVVDIHSLNVANILHFEQANIIRKLKPDIYMARGISIPYSSFFGIPVVSLYHNNSSNLGYKGVIEIGTRMSNAIKNPNFYNKLSEHIKLPYKETWYSEDPFKYMKPEKEIKFNYQE